MRARCRDGFVGCALRERRRPRVRLRRAEAGGPRRDTGHPPGSSRAALRRDPGLKLVDTPAADLADLVHRRARTRWRRTRALSRLRRSTGPGAVQRARDQLSRDGGPARASSTSSTTAGVSRSRSLRSTAARRAEPPRLTWRGCLLLPTGDVGNSVATYGDGTVLVTVLTRPGTTITDFVLGRKTGYVLERPPGADRFRVIEGTDLAGNNGLETSREDDGFYVVSFGARQVVRFDRGSRVGAQLVGDGARVHARQHPLARRSPACRRHGQRRAGMRRHEAGGRWRGRHHAMPSRICGGPAGPSDPGNGRSSPIRDRRRPSTASPLRSSSTTSSGSAPTRRTGSPCEICIPVIKRTSSLIYLAMEPAVPYQARNERFAPSSASCQGRGPALRWPSRKSSS